MPTLELGRAFVTQLKNRARVGILGLLLSDLVALMKTIGNLLLKKWGTGIKKKIPKYLLLFLKLE